MNKNTGNEQNLTVEELRRLFDFVLEAPPEAAEHLSEDEFRAYDQGILSIEDIERIDQHLAFCEVCALRMERRLTPAAGSQAAMDKISQSHLPEKSETRPVRLLSEWVSNWHRPSLHLTAALAILILTFVLLLTTITPPPRVAEVETTVRAGMHVERDLRSEPVQTYLVPLKAGDYLHAVVDQHGVDVVTTLSGPDGRTLLKVDSPSGTQGPEQLFVVASATGDHRLEVRSLNQGAASRYVLRIEALRPATARDRELAAAAEAFMRGEELRAKGGEDSLRRASDAYRIALQLWRNLGERREEAVTLRRIGQTSFALADLGEARQGFEAALVLYRYFGDREAEAYLLNSLGTVYQSLADLNRAGGTFLQARNIFRTLGDTRGEAVALHNIGRTYGLLGRTKEALEALQYAASLQRNAGDRQSEASTLLEMGSVYDQAEDSLRALQFYERTILLSHEQGDQVTEATALDRRGTTLARMGHQERALASYRLALTFFQRNEQPRRATYTLANLGWLFANQGDPRTALIYQERALKSFRNLRDSQAEAHTLLGIAWAERRLGNSALARSRIEESLEIQESLPRGNSIQVAPPPYLGVWRDYYDAVIDLLMDLKLETRAWEVSERAQLSPSPGAEPVSAPVSLPEVQRQVLDRDTLLLKYVLGEQSSYLWVVSHDSTEIYRLPGRRRIEDLAQKAYNLLLRSHQIGVRRQAELGMAALSDVILPLPASHLASKRLLIAADGVLQDIPFAALPAADRDGNRVPLLVDHEVVSLPSVSELTRSRRELAHRQPPLHQLAVIADPVYQSDDPRVRRRSVDEPPLAVTMSDAKGMGDLEQSAKSLGIESFARLPHSRREAEELLGLVQHSDSLQALGFAASRDLVLSGRLRQYRIVHFATHSLLNPERPELSGLVLSRFDEKGRPRDGFLRVQEIRDLDLRADLVVLSACRTSLSKEVRGERLVSLTQAFLQAGARGVVGSLWNVDDAATAELMSRFYEGIFQKGLLPGAALRAAQLAMYQEPRWQSTYYWAGFSLQGDWG